MAEPADQISSPDSALGANGQGEGARRFRAADLLTNKYDIKSIALTGLGWLPSNGRGETTL